MRNNIIVSEDYETYLASVEETARVISDLFSGTMIEEDDGSFTISLKSKISVKEFASTLKEAPFGCEKLSMNNYETDDFVSILFKGCSIQVRDWEIYS